MRKVSFSPEVPRGGLLTMGSVLKVTTDGFDTSPILRGAWISKNIVGTPLSPPPENVKAIEPEHGRRSRPRCGNRSSSTRTTQDLLRLPQEYRSLRFRSGELRCHGAVAHEVSGRETAPGTFQSTPQGYYESAGDVDASGEIGETEFEDVFGLKKILLSDHRKIAYNFAKKFFEYANGFKPTLEQRLDLYEMIPEKPEDCRMKNLITEVCTYSFAGDQ